MGSTREKTKKLIIYTVLILGVLALIWISWDVYAVLGGDPGAGDTESGVIRDAVLAYPLQSTLIALAVGLVKGVLLGHWFWPMTVGVRSINE